MRSALPYLLALLAFILLASPGVAQVDSTLADTTRIPLSQLPPGRLGAVPQEEFVMTRNPTTAVLFSIVPGGGQLYNEQYWKVPLFAAAGAFFIYRVIHFHNLFTEQAALAEAAWNSPANYSFLKQQREFYRDERDLNAAYFLGVEILNMIDAYVGAHMFDFDVSNDMTSRIYLDPMNNGVGLSLQW